jgi:hypothetical protein
MRPLAGVAVVEMVIDAAGAVTPPQIDRHRLSVERDRRRRRMTARSICSSIKEE